MRTVLLKSVVVFSLILGCWSCGNIPSAEELDADIAALTKQLESAKTEADQYSGGLVKALIDVRKEILTNTKLMLEQKRTGIKRFIPLSYTINGEKYVPPPKKDELLNGIQEELEHLKGKAKDIQNESDKYIGGLIKALRETELATIKNSIVVLEQKILFLKHDIPLHAAIPAPQATQVELKFKPTPGNDIDKF